MRAQTIAACVVCTALGATLSRPLPLGHAQTSVPPAPAVTYNTYVVNSDRALQVVQDVLAPYTGPAVFDSGQTMSGRVVGFGNGVDIEKPTWQSEAYLGFPAAAVTFEVSNPTQAACALARDLQSKGARAKVRKDFDSSLPPDTMSAVLSPVFNGGRWMVIFTKPQPSQ